MTNSEELVEGINKEVEVRDPEAHRHEERHEDAAPGLDAEGQDGPHDIEEA